MISWFSRHGMVHRAFVIEKAIESGDRNSWFTQKMVIFQFVMLFYNMGNSGFTQKMVIFQFVILVRLPEGNGTSRTMELLGDFVSSRHRRFYSAWPVYPPCLCRSFLMPSRDLASPVGQWGKAWTSLKHGWNPRLSSDFGWEKIYSNI